MTEKAKRTGLIIAGILLCAALVIGIAGRFTSAPTTEDPTISDNGPDTKDPLVNIDTPDVKVEIKTDTSSDKNDPGKAADSSGTEQAIQGTPTKPDAPESRRPLVRWQMTTKRRMCRKRTATRKHLPPTSRSRLR